MARIFKRDAKGQFAGNGSSGSKSGGKSGGKTAAKTASATGGKKKATNRDRVKKAAIAGGVALAAGAAVAGGVKANKNRTSAKDLARAQDILARTRATSAFADSVLANSVPARVKRGVVMKQAIPRKRSGARYSAN